VVAVPVIASVVPVAFVYVKSATVSGPVKVEVPDIVLVPVRASSPAMVRVLPSSNVSSALLLRKSVDDRPPTVSPTHTPPIAKHPLDRSMPFAKVEVAVVEPMFSTSTSTPPANVLVAVDVAFITPPRVKVAPSKFRLVLSTRALATAFV
jgi:hypothetical protein